MRAVTDSFAGEALGFGETKNLQKIKRMRPLTQVREEGSLSGRSRDIIKGKLTAAATQITVPGHCLPGSSKYTVGPTPFHPQPNLSVSATKERDISHTSTQESKNY